MRELHSTDSHGTLSCIDRPQAGGVAPGAQPQGVVHLLASTTIEAAEIKTKRDFVFEVNTGTEVHYFQARDEYDMETWVQTLNLAIGKGEYLAVPRPRFVAVEAEAAEELEMAPRDASRHATVPSGSSWFSSIFGFGGGSSGGSGKDGAVEGSSGADAVPGGDGYDADADYYWEDADSDLFADGNEPSIEDIERRLEALRLEKEGKRLAVSAFLFILILFLAVSCG